MLVRYLPVILVLATLLLVLAPLETAAQSTSGDEPRPKAAGAPVNADADRKAVPPGVDARQVRPAQAFPPERFAPSKPQTPQAPSRGGVQTPDRPQAAPAPADDPRSVEERADPGG